MFIYNCTGNDERVVTIIIYIHFNSETIMMN